ncbi:hypothetical protein [Gilvimarinus chinensis]|uniref:hypothetical protein n=1 Tax=Gilvimarinus chinensis TaxID=396005 RepID=UPI00035FDA6F|nr:hypothetical protein [Gilvimarinus chinensis]
MKSYKQIQQCAVYFLGVSAILAVATFILLSRPIHVQKEAPNTAGSFSPDVLSRIPQVQYEKIVERPLFWQGRTPYSEPEKPAPKPEKVKRNTKLDGAQILGVMAAKEASSVVFKVDESVIRLQLNEYYEGWELIEVTDKKVVFMLKQGNDANQPPIKEIEVMQREPLPREWLGKQGQLLENS